ncbi:transglycosylase [Paenibacillus sp. P46E]|uniref:transglycosylase n=1 Tax=Paenibacillus sp. P46E TaxID=1349436 RepID=UPI00211665F1|nr:transglycosylase [Paenibacillus sp. P46E]
MGKDVVGARLNLDTSKMLPAFQAIDRGAKGNAETFKVLNQEITVTTKNYTSLAAAADKMVLTSEERRKKIMAESEALIKQRTAQADLLNTKKNQMDQTNQIVNAKLAAQEAIVKKRYDAIEQQEREHQLRMATLQNKAAASAVKANAANGYSASDKTRERVLMEEQNIRRKLIQLGETESQQARANAASYEQFWIKALRTREIKEAQMREKVLQEEQNIRRTIEQTANQTSKLSGSNIGGDMTSTTSVWASRLQQMAAHALVFNTVYRGIHEVQKAMKEGLVDIESNMAGYVQTNEKYFLMYNEGAKEAVMNTKLLHEETTKFIHTAHDLGAEITDVTESARLWGRMYKDAGVVQEMVRKSTMLSTVDLVSLEDATKSMESTLAQYGVQIKDANDAMVIGGRILDSWSKVAHDTMAPAKDLGAAYERTGKIAAETGVSFDVMNGLISSGIRNTALSGENLGNMWKTVLGTIRTDKAVAEIESLGVATKEVVNGTEQWRRADDILIDLSTKVIDKNYDLTKSYADISRGVYQYAKLAASLNAGDILLGTASSIGSTGATLEYLKVQMDTISRKAAQTKASLLEIFNNAGDDGLRKTIKDVLDAIDQLLIGLTQVPSGVFEGTAALAGLLLAYKMLRAPIMNVVAAIQVLTATKTAETTAIATNTVANEVNIVTSQGATLSTVARTAATEGAVVAQGTLTVATEGVTAATAAMTAAQATSTVTMAAATAGLSLLAGAIAIYVFQKGKAVKEDRDHIQELKDEDAASQQMISQYQRQVELLPKLVNAHNSLQQSIDSGTLSADKQAKVKKQLDEVSQALVITLGDEGARQLDAANYTDAAVKIQINALNELIQKQNEARKNVLMDQKDSIQKQLDAKQAEIENAKKMLSNAKEVGFNAEVALQQVAAVEKLSEKVKNLTIEQNKLKDASAGLNVQIAELSVEGFDQLNGNAGTSSESLNDMQEALTNLRTEISKNGDAITELNGLLKQLSDGQSLNASNAADLILKYPQLATQIYKTADGWAFEKDAVNDLRKMKIQKAIDDLKSEQASAFNTKIATNDRLKAYGIEASAIKDLAQLKAKLNGVKAEVSASSIGNSLNDPEDARNFNPAFQKNAQAALDAKAAQDKAQLDEIDTIYQSFVYDSQGYYDKINALSKLYKDPNFGSSGSDKKDKSGKSDAEKANDKAKKEAEQAAKDAAEARKKAYTDDLDNFKYISEHQNWSIDQQAAGYERLKKRHAVYLAEDKDAMKQWSRDVVALSDKRYDEDKANLEKKTERMRQANLQEVEMVKASLDFYTKEVKKSYLTAEQKIEAQKQVYDLTKQYNELRYTNSANWIDKESQKMEMAGKSKTEIINMELHAYQRMYADKNRTAEQSFALEQNIYEQKKALIEQGFSDFQKDLNHRKAMGEVNTAQELQEWLKVQAMYRVGTDQRLEADEQVFALRQKLIEDETKSVETLGSTYKSKIESTRDAAIKAIEAERDAYVAGKDAEIKAIDDLLSKQQELNADVDFATALAEKQARLALLASAVGPDGIAERKQVQKDIEKLQLDHDRELAKRSLEDQKKALEDERDTKKAAFDKDIETAKSHYEDLISAFESFSSDTANRAEVLKNIQVLKESEKNAEILSQLDQFIADYQAKMSAITALSPTVGNTAGTSYAVNNTVGVGVGGIAQRASDTLEYNANKDAWDAAKEAGNKAEMERLAARNEELRKKYGIVKDSGKIQSFSEGGKVKGPRGAATMIEAHAGEIVLNDRQQSNLFKLLNFNMPSLNFSMPQFSMPAASGNGGGSVNRSETVFNMGDTYIADESTARVFWSEKENLVRRFQASGVK